MGTWIDDFSVSAGLTPEDARQLNDAARPVSLPVGYRVFEAGEHCKAYVLVRSGRVRVHQLDADGGEIVLFRLGPGDTCILNTAALLAGRPYAAYAVTETEVEAVTISIAAFDTLLATSQAFRAFVFRSHAERIAALMEVVRNLAFERIDVRLARRLIDLADGGGWLGVTHADLAIELGTAREVVSRRLKAFERRGWVQLCKGAITILAPEQLDTLGGECRRR